MCVYVNAHIVLIYIQSYILHMHTHGARTQPSVHTYVDVSVCIRMIYVYTLCIYVYAAVIVFE